MVHPGNPTGHWCQPHRVYIYIYTYTSLRMVLLLLHVLLLQTLVVHLVRNVAALTNLLHGGGCRRRDGKVAIRRLWKGNHTGIPVVDSGHSRNRMNSMVGNHRMWIAAVSGNHTDLLLSRHLYLRELSECRLVLLLLLLLLLHLKGFGFRDGLAVLICLELQQATGHGGSVAARPLSLLLRDLLLLLLLLLLLFAAAAACCCCCCFLSLLQ